MRRIAALAGAVSLCACATHTPAPNADWHAYQSQAHQLTEQARYRDALAPARQELAVAQQSLPAGSPDLAVALMDLAYVERETGTYKDAAGHYQQALDIRSKAFGLGSAQTAETLSALARNEYLPGDVPTANGHFKSALAIQEKLLPKDDPAIAETLTYYGRSLADYNEMDDAKALLDRALALREKTPGPGQLDLARTLNQIGFFTILNGDDDGASKLLQRALAILDVSGQPPRPELAYTLDLLGNVDLDQSHFPDAELKFKRALDIMSQVYGPDHQEVANVQDDIARTYDDEGRFREAEEVYKRSIATYTRALGPDNVNVASVTGNLAQMQDSTGEYQEAEANFHRALDIDGRIWTHDRVNMGFDLSNFAQLYRALGMYQQAEPLMQQALALFQKNLPPNHPYVLTELNNLGELYTEEGQVSDDPARYAQAESYLTRAIAANEKALNPDDPVLATGYNNLAEAYEGERKLAEAETFYRKAYTINRKTLGPNHPVTAQFAENLANLLSQEDKFSEAEALFPPALAIFTKTFGPHHTNVANVQFNWAAERYHHSDRKGASPLFDAYFGTYHRFFLEQYPYMTERDRLQLLATSRHSFPTYFSYCLRYHTQDPALAAKMYDILLWEKGLVGNSIGALRAKIAASGDTQALALLGQLSVLKTQLATLLNNPGEDHTRWQSQVQELQKQTDGVESQLITRSRALAEEQSLEKVTWRDVQKTLKPGEAAVEFVRFRYNDGAKDTDTAYYVALVVTPQTRDAPQFIVVGKAAELEADPVADYAGHLGKFGAVSAPGKTGFYRAFWQPLLPSLKGVTRVYLAPDGVLNQASLGIVADDAGKLLMQSYDLHIVPSTRDVLRAPYRGDSVAAVLLGGPDFELAPDRYLAAVTRLNGPANGDAQTRYAGIRGSALPVARDSSGGHCPLPGSGILCPLPGAAEEVSGIDELLTRKQWQASLYQGDQALEEAVKQVHHPRLLHLATHGFFLPDQKSINEDPMLRSGLYLAGADNTLGGNPPPEGADNGILTAYEAAQLDLEGTELVVLSACDTGLGTTQNGEGVFGLDRALQEAGAQAVVMSMWSVPDQETRELMQLFYANWLGGMEKHEALRQAELKEREVVKQRYGHDLPYYWGAFVMVGR